MKGRTAQPAASVPPELRDFDPGRWSEGPLDVRAAFARWCAARAAWDDQHGWAPGDSLDRLREQVAARRALPYPSDPEGQRR